ncbi:MAG: hypothetical protein GY865_03175 [candidate division Zixibacteria bacterium]|nr:hypothetical protein [candidate division Zixibacteria bacterium]
MAEKNGNGPKKDKKNDLDERFRYVGFEVETGKIGEHFKSDAEKESWIKRVLAKREKDGSKLREETSFDKPRVAGYERIVLTITSVILIASLFLPWFSGYKEYEVEAVVEAPAPVEEVLTDSAGIALMTDSAGIELAVDSAVVSAEVVEPELESEVLATTEADMDENGEAASTSEETEIVAPELDEQGFASISGQIKRKEYKKEYYSSSALGSFGMLGMVFSSGIVLKVTGALFIIYVLLCLGMAGMTLYTLYGVKGDDDTLALKLKDMMKYGWIPLGIWFGCFVLSVFGASYSFDTTDMLKQLGDSYGIGTYLGLLGYGFYISLGCFIMNAVKGVEI